MPEPVLKIRNVSKAFGGLVAVNDVSLDLHPNEIHAVIGPNGAGKSTLLATIAGDLRLSSGSIFLRGENITTASVVHRTRLGIGRTYQRSAVIPGFSAIDNVRLAALHGGVGGAARLLKPLAAQVEATAHARAALGRVGLSERETVATDILSHGERRRLEIASVIALDPPVLLLDEPLAGLGADEIHDVVLLIRGLKGKSAIMLIEHDIDVVFALADRITVMDNGRMIASGDPASVRSNPAVQQAYLGEADE